MSKYISILRGINVGGHKKIKMADLKQLYLDLGYQNVETYIQSGNVGFNSPHQKADEIKQEIEAAIEKAYSFFVPVLIRSTEEMIRVVSNCPFDDLDLDLEARGVLVTFLASPPLAEKVRLVQAYVHLPERLIIIGKEVYLHCPNGYGNTKLSNTFLEAKLGIQATTRNWKTVTTLRQLAVD